MTRPDVDALLCHCAHGRDGHALADCGTTVRRGTYGRAPLPGTCGTTAYGLAGPPVRASATATGTCRSCGQTGIKVVRGRVVTSDRRDLHPFPVGVPVCLRPVLATHRERGKRGAPCAGAGDVPAETRWHSAQYDAIVRDYGPGTVVTR